MQSSSAVFPSVLWPSQATCSTDPSVPAHTPHPTRVLARKAPGPALPLPLPPSFTLHIASKGWSSAPSSTSAPALTRASKMAASLS